jgi:6-phospho-beta-glucosidase
MFAQTFLKNGRGHKVRKDKLKMVTIGGGSSYTPELIEGLLRRRASLPVKDLWLVDVEAGSEKMEIVAALGRRMVAKAGADLVIHTSLDRRAALPGADYVTTQIRVGRLAGRIADERIPLSHGMIGQETNGAGGLFLGLRTIPVILDIAREVEELCPEAWLVNFSNPSGMVTEALLRYSTNPRVIGLCNVPVGMKMAIAAALGVEASRLRMDQAGLNHMVFGLRTYVDGQDVSAKVREVLVEKGESISMNNIPPIPWTADFARALGVVPCPYLRYYLKRDEVLEEMIREFGQGETRAEKVQRLETELFALYRDPALDSKPKQLEERGGAYYSDAACDLIDSIHNDRRDIQTVNTRNRGAIVGLPPESAVEVSSVITAEGPIPLAMGELPLPVGGLVAQIKAFERQAALAAVTGDYGAALLALTMNPLSGSDALAKTVLDELFEAHRAYLPRFEGRLPAPAAGAAKGRAP